MYRFAFSCRPRVQTIERDVQDRRLDRVQPEVAADPLMVVLRLAAVDPEVADALGQVGIAGQRHVGALAVEVDGQDGLRAVGDGRFHAVRPEVASGRIDIHEDRPGTEPSDGAGRGEERVGRRDHLIPRPHIERHQCHQEGVGPGRHADRERHAGLDV